MSLVKLKGHTIGGEVKRIREFLGLSQIKLSDLAGITPAALSQIEAGKRDCSVWTVIRLAKALNVTTDRILLGTE